MPGVAGILALVAQVVYLAGAVIAAQDKSQEDLTGGVVGIVRDLPPSIDAEGSLGRWRSVAGKARSTFFPEPVTVNLSEFLELGCMRPAAPEVAETLQNCTEMEASGSRALCTVKCGELAADLGGLASASAFIRGAECLCCANDEVLEAAEWLEPKRCGLACPRQDEELYGLQPLKAQRRWAAPWTCGGEEEDVYTAFRQYDAVSPLGRRGVYSALFGAWYEVAVLPAQLLPGPGHPAAQTQVDAGRWTSYNGFAFYLHAVHVGLGYPVFWHQSRLPFVPECLHMDGRGRIVALVRRNATALGVEVGLDTVVFSVGCSGGYGGEDTKVIPAVTAIDVSVSVCTFDVERSVLAFVAKPWIVDDQAVKPLLVEVDVVRLIATSRVAGVLEHAITLEQCRQTSITSTNYIPSLAALVVSPGGPGGDFSMLPPRTLDGAGPEVQPEDLGNCDEGNSGGACTLAGPERPVVQMGASSAHGTLPFVFVPTELALYSNKELLAESSAQLARIPCEPDAGPAERWPTAAAGHHRRRGAPVEAPFSLHRHIAQSTTASRCGRGMYCTFTVEGVGVTGDDHLVAVWVPQEEAPTAMCDLRAAMIRSISDGAENHHQYFRHEELSSLWVAAPLFYRVIFHYPGEYLFCYYVLPTCTGNISDATFAGVLGQRVGTLVVQGPEAKQHFFCKAFHVCTLHVKGWFFDEPLFVFLSSDATCDAPFAGDKAYEAWQGQPWRLELVEKDVPFTTVFLEEARPLHAIVCFCIGTLDGSEGPFMKKCQGTGAPFGDLTSALPVLSNEWSLSGNVRAIDPPDEFTLLGVRLDEGNRLVVLHMPNNETHGPKPCSAEKVNDRLLLAPIQVQPAAGETYTSCGEGDSDAGCRPVEIAADSELTFHILSLTPDEGFEHYGMSKNSLQLSEDGKVLISTFMSTEGVNFALCWTDQDIIRPLPDAVHVGTMKLPIPFCGNGILNFPEECDDGNTRSGDGCAEGCEKVEDGWFLRHENRKELRYRHPDGGPILEEICGDGLVVGRETCDDKNVDADDGCSRVCTIERGYVCDWLSGLRRSVCTGICGDYITIPGKEGCDDGTVEGGDGCSPSCQVEQGYICEQVPINGTSFAGLGIETVSDCQIDCRGSRDLAALALDGIYRCEEGMRPPADAEPHWCVMYPRDCPGMPPYEGPHQRWLGCDDTVESIKAQCQVIAKPAMESAMFDRSGALVTITLSEPARMKAAMVGQDPCELLFEDAAEALGQGATCRQNSETQLLVTLGRKPALRPGASLTVKRGSIYLDPEGLLARSGNAEWPANWPLVEAQSHGVSVEPPLGGFFKLVAALQAQEKVGLGTDIELDAAESHGGGGHLSFSWGIRSVQLNQVWRDGFFGKSEVKERQAIVELRKLLAKALEPYDGDSIAIIPASVVLEMDSVMLAIAGLSRSPDDEKVLEPVLVSFQVMVVSLFDGQVDSMEWMMKVYPQFAVPLVKQDSPVSQTVTRDQEVSLIARVLAPAGLPPSLLPPFELVWMSDSTTVDIQEYVTSNPGVLRIPGLTFERGKRIFFLRCVYKAAGGKLQEVLTTFEVTFEHPIPVVRLDGPGNTSSACKTTLSVERSYDPGLVYDGTKRLRVPLPGDLYLFEWECRLLGQGQRYMEAEDTDRVVQGLLASARGCDEDSRGIVTNANGTELTIPSRAFAGNTLLRIRTRVKPATGRISEWASLYLRLVAVNAPAVSFPQVPPSPLRPTVPHEVWALSVSSPDCPQGEEIRPSLFDVGLGRVVQDDGTQPVLEIRQTYQGLENVPAPVRAKVLAGTTSNPFENSVVSVYWLQIHANTMIAGYRYRVILRGGSGASGWSAQTYVFEANAGPVGGSLFVNPTQGKAVETAFRLTSAEWEDSHHPLMYIFMLRPANNASAPVQVVADWSVSHSALIPLPVGNWTVITRARDALKVESVDLTSGPVLVEEAPANDKDNLDRVSLIAERSTDSTQLLSSVESVLEVARGTDSSGRRLQSSNSSGLSADLANSMLHAMDKGQKLLVSAGSKGGASRQAKMLLGVTSGALSNGTEDANGTSADTQMATDATRVLGSTFSLLEGAEDEADPSGISATEARDFVACASTLAVLEVPDGYGGRRLSRRKLGSAASNTLGSVADGIGRQLAQNLISRNGSGEMPGPIETPGLTVGAAAMPVVVNETSSGRRLGGQEGTGRLEVAIPGVGVFGIPLEALAMSAASLSALGYQGTTSAGISANQWGGNPFGPRERTLSVEEGPCNQSGVNTSGENTTNATWNLSGNTSCSYEETKEQSPTIGNVVSVSLSSALGLASDIGELREPITITMRTGQNYFDFEQQMQDGKLPQCLWWDPQTNSWGGGGCKTLAVLNGGKELLCSCTHLTSFGAFAEEGLNVLAGSNIDVFTDFSYEGLRPDNPTLWFVVSLVGLQFIWLCLGAYADRSGLTTGTEDQMKKVYFQQDSNDPAQQEVKEVIGGDQQVQGSRQMRRRFADMMPSKEKNAPMVDLLCFRNMIQLLLDHHNIGWMDMSSKRVRDHVHEICRDEMRHALRKHRDDHRSRQGHHQDHDLKMALLKVFRTGLSERLASQLGRKALSSRATQRRKHLPGLPRFPWQFPASLKITCSGVHPLEKEQQVRQMLKVDEVLKAFIVIDEFTVKIFLRDLAFQNVDDAVEDPFLEVSWLAIFDHEGILDDRAIEGPSMKDVERLEDRAASWLTPRGGIQAGGDGDLHGMSVPELCDEWEDQFILRRERSEYGALPLPPPVDGPPEPQIRVTSRQMRPLESPPDEDALPEEIDEPPVAEHYERWVSSREGTGPVAATGLSARLAVFADDSVSSSGGSHEDFLPDDFSSAGPPRSARRSGPEPPPLATILREDQSRAGFFRGLFDGFFWPSSDARAEAHVEQWEESMMQRRKPVTPRLAQRAALLGAEGRGAATRLDFWTSGGTISEATGVPKELTRHAMLLLISANPPGGEGGDMSWVNSGWFFSWEPLQTRELKHLQQQATQAAMVAGRSGDEPPAKVEVLLCGLEPKIHEELQEVVPKLCKMAQEEEEASQENFARERRRRAGGADDPVKDIGFVAEGSSSSDDDEEAAIRAMEARWETPTRGDIAVARARDGRGRRPHSFEGDLRINVFVAIPDYNHLPMQAQMVVEEMRWNAMHLAVEDDAANLDKTTGPPAVLRFSDLYEGTPQPFTGWAVPLGRISSVRLIRHQHFPLPALGQDGEAVDLATVREGQVYDLDALVTAAASVDDDRDKPGPTPPPYTSGLPPDFREIVEVVVAPREEAPYRILIRPVQGTATSGGQIAAQLDFAVGAWQEEDRLHRRPKMAQIARTGQLERQAEDLKRRALDSEEEARQLKEKKASRHMKDLKEIDDYIDLLFRRYEFILWDPVTLCRRLLLRDHPMSGIFVPHLYSFAVERILIFSCALAGSIATAALFFDAGAGGESAGNNATAGNLTGALGSTTMMPTTTMDFSEAEAQDPLTKVYTQIWVSLISVMIAGIPAASVFYLFKRSVKKDIASSREQSRILWKWKVRRRVGYVIAALFLVTCYFYLWQFAMARPLDVQRDFTASSAINLVWKIVVKPFLAFMFIAALITIVRMSSVFDGVLFVVPWWALDFSMFTARDVDDLLNYETLAKGFMRTEAVEGAGDFAF